MNITVVGAGYVGLVAAACFARIGHNVCCVEKDQTKLAKLNNDEVPIYEPGLSDILKNYSHKIQFTDSMQYGCQGTHVVFIAVGTPPNEDGSADLTHVLNVAAEIGSVVSDNIVVVDKSTVPVGTADKVLYAINHAMFERNVQHHVEVVSNPEFLREGNAIDDFLYPDRVVIGASTDHARKLLRDVYGFLPEKKIIFTTVKSAEMIKYASNAMLATRISFINEIANLCEAVGANVEDVAKGMGADSRIGPLFLNAGIGYGGSCFPKDVKALIETAAENCVDMKVLNSVEDANYAQKRKMIKVVLDWFEHDIAHKKIGILGTAFKPDTDDMREAPASVLINSFTERGAKVAVYDPEALDECRRIHGDIVTYTSSAADLLSSVDFVVIATEWDEFKRLTPADFTETTYNLVFDGRNLYDPAKMKANDIDYISIGR